MAGEFGSETYTEPYRIAQNIDRLQGYYAIRGTEYVDTSDSSLPVKTLVNPGETNLGDIQYYLEDGKVYIKGKNGYGRLGLGDEKDRDDYQQVTALADEQISNVWSFTVRPVSLQMMVNFMLLDIMTEISLVRSMKATEAVCRYSFPWD